MSLPPLLLKIGADTKDLEQSVDRVKSELSGLGGASGRAVGGLRRLGDGANNLGKRMLPVSAAVTAAAGGMYMLASGSAKVGDEIAKSSRAAGVSTDAMQELRFALGQVAGVGDQQTTAMLSTLTRRMGEAVDGNEKYADALAGIGISMQDVASGAVTTDEVFMRLASAMEGAESDAAAAAMGFELLGREGSALGGKLRGTGDDVERLRKRAQELGIVLGKDALMSAEEFLDKTDELQRQMAAARMEIGMALLPVALAMATAFQDKVVPAIVAVANRVSDAIDWFGALPAPVQEAAGIIATLLGVGGPVLMAVGFMAKALAGLIAASGPVGLFIAAATLAYVAWQKWGDDIIALLKKVSGWFENNFGGMIEAGGLFVDAAKEQFGHFRDLAEGVMNGDLDQIMASAVEIMRAPLKLMGALWESDFAEPLRDVVSGIGPFLAQKFEEIGEFFLSLPERFYEFGVNIVQGLLNGFNMMWEKFKENLIEKVEWMPNWVKDRLGIHSPSRVFMEIGENIGEGLKIGIENTFGMVKDAIGNLAGMVTGGADGMAKGVVDAMGKMFEGSKPIAAAQALINTFQGITEALKTRDFASAAKVAAQGFAAVRGIRSARPGSSGGGGSSATGGAVSAAGGPEYNINLTVLSDPQGNVPVSQVQEMFTDLQQQLNRGQRLAGAV